MRLFMTNDSDWYSLLEEAEPPGLCGCANYSASEQACVLDGKAVPLGQRANTMCCFLLPFGFFTSPVKLETDAGIH